MQRHPLKTLNSICIRSQPAQRPPIIHVENGTFYRNYPSSKDSENPSNPSMFPGLTFSLPSSLVQQQHWAILGPSSSGKTTLLEILHGHHLCIPPAARSFPFLSTPTIQWRGDYLRNPGRAIQYVSFSTDGVGMDRSAARGAYLSARYESRREDTDFSVSDYLKGNIELNPSETTEKDEFDEDNFNGVIKDLNLGALITMPMGNLSNGQTRRAKIAKALLGKPLVLLLDEPFMGLDPPTLTPLSPLLYRLAQSQSPRLILALRPQDLLPDWITHLILLGPSLRVLSHGRKEFVVDDIKRLNSSYGYQNYLPLKETDKSSRVVSKSQRAQHKNSSLTQIKSFEISREGLPLVDETNLNATTETEALVEMENVKIEYGEKQVLGGWNQGEKEETKDGLWWTIRRRERWGVFGPNGSGKTTLLSLICSDHPQSYSLPIKIFGQGRLPKPGQPGISIFDIQARIGHSSPEIHAFFPRTLTIRQTIRNAWANTFLGTPRPSRENDMLVDACLRWFEPELNPRSQTPSSEFFQHPPQDSESTHWADTTRFGDTPFSSQRVALLLRALVKAPDLVILDEAFSGMDDAVRDKCMLFLTWGETRYFKPALQTITIINTPTPARQIATAGPNSSVSSSSSGRALIPGLAQRQALICVSHLREEVPGLVRQWIRLPEAGEGRAPGFGRFRGPLEGDLRGWRRVWGGAKEARGRSGLDGGLS